MSTSEWSQERFGAVPADRTPTDQLDFDAEVVVVCSRDGHRPTRVARFARVTLPDLPPDFDDVDGLVDLQPDRYWRVLAVTKRPTRHASSRLDEEVEREQLQGQVNRRKLRAACPTCRLDVQRTTAVFEEVLDVLARHDVRTIELGALAARVSSSRATDGGPAD